MNDPHPGRSAGLSEFGRTVTRAALGSVPPAAVGAAARAIDGHVREVVLVEGASDRAAVEALAAGRRRDLEADGVLVLDMGGATNVARFVTVLDQSGLELRLAALCDAAERSHYFRAFDRARRGSAGVFVCVTDLEDELIRTLGADVVEDVVRAEGEFPALVTFRRQPAQRRRTAEQQLHRFVGTRSGRKIRYAVALAERCAPQRTPDPLRELLDHLTVGG